MGELFYFKQYKDGRERIAIDYPTALDTLLTTYRDNDMTRDMLTIPNRIMCIFSTVEVEEKVDGKNRVLMAGLCNMLPMDVEYDENNNHIATP